MENKKHRVVTNWGVVDVHDEALNASLARLKKLNRAERRRMMKSVSTALENGSRLVRAGLASRKDLEDLANDIGIWFANEIFEGRTKRGVGATPEEARAFHEEFGEEMSLDRTFAKMQAVRNARNN